MKEQVQEDRAGYVLPFRTTKSQISESVVEFCEQGPPEDKKKKWGRSDGRRRASGSVPRHPPSRFRTLEYERRVKLSVAA